MSRSVRLAKNLQVRASPSFCPPPVAHYYFASKAGRYAHARQFKLMRRAIKHQRTIVGRVAREIDRKAGAMGQAAVLMLMTFLPIQKLPRPVNRQKRKASATDSPWGASTCKTLVDSM
ncbi:hypothetical protein [Orrella sp. 11846]|uniref:hypothetical protein n=1 Tax=Orrella sp. 11846 TaxID=3409913 RepID=UPI003B5B737B